ncbi:MAG: DNA polymerase I [Bacteroidia bacterium]|jgi:DNA polymerase-1|nr:DNA polymerase I [Bacteroidia bacterium]
MTRKKLFLLDGMALVYRAYFAFSQNPRITSYGFNTSAIFGYTNTVLDILKKEKPTHIGVSFDTAAPTARHEEYEHYKAHREEQPEDITKALPYIMRVTEALRIPILTLDGYEADDIIGTLAKKAEKQNFDVYMMTPDKDFGQLVSEHIFIYKPARMGNDYEIMGVPEVLKKWEITDVKQVIDILGMWGDAVDNIPGIPGIGEKTAKLLVQKYGSMEGLYEHTHELKGKQKENVENNREQAFLSKRLATIDIQVPIELEEDKLILEPADKDACEKLFAELEFKTMAKRLFGEEPGQSVIESKTAGSNSGAFDLFNQGSVATKAEVATEEEPSIPKNTIENTPHSYHLIDTLEKRKSLLEQLLQQTAICFDSETTSLDELTAEVVGLSFSYKTGEAYYVPFPENRDEAQAMMNEFKVVFENDSIIKIGQNIKYDLSILKNYGVELRGKWFDTMLAHYLIDADLRHGMDFLATNYLNYEPVSIETLIGKKGKNQLSMRNVELEKIKEYAAEDADITLQLHNLFAPQLEQRNAKKLFEEVEIPLINVLNEMEREGIRVNAQFLNEYSVELAKEIGTLEKRIHELAGVNFNIASPKQLGEVLFDHLKLDPKAKKTKTGQYQTGEDILQGLSEHEIARCILDVRQLQKLKSTYVDALPALIHPKTGRVHTSFNQAVAATGRLSSTDPNLQNIPIKTDKGREIRKAFVPRNDDYILMSVDYSQIELRVIASIAKEENMIESFVNGIDIHTATAAKVYGKSIEEVTPTERRNAKAVNFGIIYGQSAFGLSQGLGIGRKEAAAIIDEYFKQYPRIKNYMSDMVHFAQEHGYVETILGRRRYLRDINSKNFTVRGFAERNAINAPIQGSAADMIKVAMIKVDQAVRHSVSGIRHSKLILQVHDELLFDVHKNEIEPMKQLVKHEMENAVKLDVPIVAEVGIGDNWLEAH